MKTSFATLALGLTALASTAQAACPTDLEAAAVAAAIVARQPVVAPAGEMRHADFACPAKSNGTRCCGAVVSRPVARS